MVFRLFTQMFALQRLNKDGLSLQRECVLSSCATPPHFCLLFFSNRSPRYFLSLAYSVIQASPDSSLRYLSFFPRVRSERRTDGPQAEMCLMRQRDAPLRRLTLETRKQALPKALPSRLTRRVVP